MTNNNHRWGLEDSERYCNVCIVANAWRVRECSPTWDDRSGLRREAVREAFYLACVSASINNGEGFAKDIG